MLHGSESQRGSASDTREPVLLARRGADPIGRAALFCLAVSCFATSAMGCGDTEAESAPSLNDRWFEAVTEGCGLDPATFQLYQGAAPIPFTSEDLWSTFDAVPPLSTSHFYNPAQANSFSSDYGAMIFSLAPRVSTLETDLGDCYVPFLAAFDASGSADLLTFWQSWSLASCPAAFSVGTADIQSLTQDPITLAQATWVQANQGLAAKAYTTTISTLKSLIVGGPSKSVSFDSPSTLADFSWIPGLARNDTPLARLLSGEAGGRPDALSTRFARGAISIDAMFDHLITLGAEPLSQVSSDPILSTYKPWFSAPVMGMAFANPGNTLWRAGVTPDWQSTFGGEGNLKRMCTAIVVVDGVTVAIASSATFSSGELAALQTSLDGGLPGGSATLNDDGTITITSTSPLGNPAILGVLVSSAAELWR